MNTQAIIAKTARWFPNTEAIYLFGSCATKQQRPDSDGDIALLLPPIAAKELGSLGMSDLRFELQDICKRTVDLINLREVSTILQKEVVFAGQRIFTQNELAAEEFEMLTLSYYQKLNDERQKILEEFKKTGRAYAL